MLVCYFSEPEIMCAITKLSRADNVTQTIPEVTAQEGGQVTIDCQYETISSNPDFFWYVQHPESSPQFILQRDYYNKNEEEPGTDYAAKLNKENKSIYLRVSDLSVSDTGIYYCALWPTVSLSVYSTVQEPLSLTKVLTLFVSSVPAVNTNKILRVSDCGVEI
ncbi:hypothetical protein FKM82_023858 [Ascaphus truei]